VDGRVIAPASAPRRVKRVIEAANRLVEKPYIYGGGHKPFSSLLDRGYDCSGAVSYALYGGRFLRSPLPSGDLMSWGEEGPGEWITVYAHGGHAYVVVAGLRFDTSMRDPDARAGAGRCASLTPSWRATPSATSARRFAGPGSGRPRGRSRPRTASGRHRPGAPVAGAHMTSSCRRRPS
jgi:hypothetical protein